MKRLFGLFLVLVLYCSSLYSQIDVIDIIGDSISKGANPYEPEYAGWAQMLYGEFGDYPTIYTLFPDIETHNHSVSGSRASDWASPDYEPMQRVLSNQPDIVIVFIGGNDFLAYFDDGELSQAELDEVEQNLRTIIATLQTHLPEARILIVYYYDLFDGLSMNLPDLFSQYRSMSQGVIEGHRIIRDVAHENDLVLIDGIYDSFMHHCYGEELGDELHKDPDYVLTPLREFDIHPVTPGHAAIYDQIFLALKEIASEYMTPADSSWTLYQ